MFQRAARATLNLMDPKSSEPLATGVPMCEITPDLVISSWSSGAENLTGRMAADVIGKPCWQVLEARDAHRAAVCSASCEIASRALAGQPSCFQEVWVSAKYVRATMLTTAVQSGPDRVLVHVFETDGERLTPADAPPLTTRQLEILRLLSNGRSTKEIAADLGLSVHTVRHHIQAIRTRLGAKSRVQALHHARAWHLI